MSDYLIQRFGDSYLDALTAGGYAGDTANIDAMEAYAKNYSDYDNNADTAWTALNSSNINRAGLDATAERQKYRDMGYTNDWGAGNLGSFMESIKNPNYGNRPGVNQGLAGLTGYQGNFGGGEFGTWLNTRDQAMKNAVSGYLGARGLDGKANPGGQNLGADPWVNRAIVDATGYTGDFGRGELGAWLQNNPGYENTIKNIQNAAPPGSGLNMRYFGPQANGGNFSGSRMAPTGNFSGSRMAPGPGASKIPMGMAGATLSPFQMGQYSPIMQMLGSYAAPGVTNNDSNNEFGTAVKTSRMAPQQSGIGGIMSYGSNATLGGARTPRSGPWQF